jgi:GTP-binding protein EngB required for normal cell division
LPGETKRITFYQVTTQLSLAESNAPHSEGNANVHLGNNQTITQEKAQKSDRSARNGIKEKVIQEKESDNSTHSGIKEKENVSLLLIDLPGYGFAYTSDERMNEWKDLMQHFLVERGHMLKRILLLVDARHGFKKADFDFLDTLQQSLVSSSDTYYTNGGSSLDERVTEKSKRRVEIKSLPPIQVVLTKCDLVQQKDLARRVVQVKRQLSDSLVRESKGALPVMLVSAKAGLGYNNIRGSRARGGILELQRELASIAPRPKLIMNMIKTKKPIAPVVNKQIKRR